MTLSMYQASVPTFIRVLTNLAYLEMCQYDLSPYPAVIKWYGVMKDRPNFDKTAPKA